MIDRDVMAKALIRSDLMRRYVDYAKQVPTMESHETVEQLADQWAGLVCAAYEEVYGELPTYLACGCISGTHPSTIDAIRKHHPDVVVGDDKAIAKYFDASWES